MSRAHDADRRPSYDAGGLRRPPIRVSSLAEGIRIIRRHHFHPFPSTSVEAIEAVEFKAWRDFQLFQPDPKAVCTWRRLFSICTALPFLSVFLLLFGFRYRCWPAECCCRSHESFVQVALQNFTCKRKASRKARLWCRVTALLKIHRTCCRIGLLMNARTHTHTHTDTPNWS